MHHFAKHSEGAGLHHESPDSQSLRSLFVHMFTVARTQDDRHIRPHLHHPPGQLDPRHLRHGHVRDDNVKLAGLRHKSHEGFPRV